MNCPSRSAVLAAVALAAAVPAAVAAEVAGDGRRCGEYCLRVALPALGFAPGEVAAAVQSLGVAPPVGHAAADLTAAAAAAGGRAAAVSTTLAALRARQDLGEPLACVLHLDGDHYALLNGFADDGSALIVDPPRSYSLPPESLAKRWDGTAVLVSRDALTPEADLPRPFPWATAALAAAGGLGLLAAGGVWLARRQPTSPRRPAGRAGAAGLGGAAGLALLTAAAGCGGGDIDRGGPVVAAGGPPRAVFGARRLTAEIPVGFGAAGRHEFVFPLTNRGGSPLTVFGVDASCGCTAAGVSAAVVAPGETAEVRAVVTPSHPERRNAAVTVRTDDPGEPAVRLAVAWEAVAPLSPDPPELDFGDLRPGETATRTVRLVRRAGAAAGGPGEPGAVTIAAGAAGGGAVLDVERTGDAVEVRVTAPPAPAVGSGLLTVEVAGGGDPLRVPVRYRVRDALAATPERLFLGSGPPGATVAGRVVLAAAGPLELTGDPRPTASPGGPAVTVAVRRLTDDRALVDLAAVLPPGAGRHELTLTVAARVGGVDRTLAVPITAFVAGPAVAAR